MTSKKIQALGLMSGTSMDGIDAAWIETDGAFYVRSLGGFSMPYDANFYREMRAMEASMTFVQPVTKEMTKQRHAMHEKIDTLHARAVIGLCEKYALKPKEIAIVGYHGQTMYHQPAEKCSIQMGDPCNLSRYLNIPVMGHVRQQDIALGGQGAPVAPIYHQALVIRDNLAPAAVINCGGIANITGITGNSVSDLMGFDVGPGNALLDRWVYEKTQGKASMDKDGQYALAGKVHPAVLKELHAFSCIKYQHNYYQLPPPKSLDLRDMHWTPSLAQLSLEDGCATLAVFTAECIIEALRWISNVKALRHIILVGGGWHHPVILQHLQTHVDAHCVRGDDVGWSSQYLEAELMAFLAVRRLKNLPITFPMTTGVVSPMIGGEIFYPPIHCAQPLMPVE